MDPLPARPDDGASRLQRIERPEPPRLKRLRVLSHLMDQSIVLPNGYRIGLDPILGLLPGIGDLLGASISTWMVYEAARLGTPKRVLLRMFGNIFAELLVGTIPILGDAFDAVWKANTRNMRLLEQSYHPGLKERSGRTILISFGVFLVAIAGASLALVGWILFLIISLIEKIIGS
jgi:hypothetical protein